MKSTGPSGLFWTKTKLFWTVLLFLATLKTHKTFIGQGDEPHYILLTESLYLDRDVDIKNNIVSPYLWDHTPADHHATMRPDGKERPHAPPGLPFLAMPVYAAAHAVIKAGMAMGHFQEKVERRIFVKNTFATAMMIMGSFFATLLFGAINSFTDNRRLAWFLALVLAITPPLLSYGLVFYPDMPSAIFIAVLCWKLCRGQEIDWPALIMLAILPWIHPRNSFVSILLFGLFQVWPSEADLPRIQNLFLKRNLIMTALYVASWFFVLLYNYVLWGNISLAGYYAYLTIKSFDLSALPTALPALFMDRSFGLLMMNPLYLFSFSGIVILFRENKRAALILLGVMGIYLAALSGYVYWWGGWSPGPRYLVPIVPLLAFLSALTVVRLWPRKEWRIFFTTLLSVMGVVALLYWQRPKALWNLSGGDTRFWTYSFGETGEKIQNVLPDFFLPAPLPHLTASIHVLFFSLILFFAVRDHRSLNKPK